LKAYVDGELSPERHQEIEAAMEQDARLRQEMEEIRVLSRLIGECVVEIEPVGLEETLSALERRRPFFAFSMPKLGLCREPARYAWVWALGLFVLVAIFWPSLEDFSQAKSAAKKSVAMRDRNTAVEGESAKAEAPVAYNHAGRIGFRS